MFYRYTGDIKNLKPNLWTFQKLYANNYKSYRKNGIWMFVASKMRLEIDNIKSIDQVKVVGFILENMDKSDSFWQEPSTFFPSSMIPIWVVQCGKIIPRIQAIKNKADWYRKFEKDSTIPYLEDGEFIRLKWVKTIKELDTLGGVSLDGG